MIWVWVIDGGGLNKDTGQVGQMYQDTVDQIMSVRVRRKQIWPSRFPPFLLFCGAVAKPTKFKCCNINPSSTTDGTQKYTYKHYSCTTHLKWLIYDTHIYECMALASDKMPANLQLLSVLSGEQRQRRITQQGVGVVISMSVQSSSLSWSQWVLAIAARAAASSSQFD